MNKKKMIVIGSISLAVIAAIVATVILLMSVFGGGSGAFTVKAGEATVEKGGIVKVPIEVSGNPGFCAAMFSVNYDGEVLEYLGFENGDVVGQCEVAPSGNKVVAILENSEAADNEKNGTLYTLKFTAIGNSGAESDIKLELEKEGSFINIDEKVVTPDIENGKVTIK